jgi:GNAT superfamily N-acetyltransferase
LARKEDDVTTTETGYALAIEDAPAEADVEAVRAGLIAFNLRHTTDDAYRRLAAFLRDEAGRVVGGLVGETYWGWLHVDLLWVSEELRGRGYGSRLLAAAEAEAVRRGCGHAYLDTLGFQAPDFYRKRGYRLFGEPDDFPAGHRRYFLAKRLDGAAASGGEGD